MKRRDFAGLLAFQRQQILLHLRSPLIYLVTLVQALIVCMSLCVEFCSGGHARTAGEVVGANKSQAPCTDQQKIVLSSDYLEYTHRTRTLRPKPA